MHQFSDSDTPDSDEGIRFKTDSTRHKERNRKATERRREKSRSAERQRNRRKRDDNRSRTVKRDKYRRRSYSRERRDKRKDRPDKHPMKHERGKRHLQDSKHKSKDINATAVEKTPGKVKVTSASGVKTEDSLEAFGPVLPPSLLGKSVVNVQSALLVTEITSDERLMDKCNNGGCKEVFSTSPVSSEDHDLMPEDDCETSRPVNTDLKQLEQKDVIEIEDSDVELENLSNSNPNKSSFDNNYVRLKGPTRVDTPIQPAGPFLPDHLREHLLENALQNGNPNLSLSDDNSDEIEEGEIVGPILPGSKCISAAHIALEERALEYKLNLHKTAASSELSSREDWMLSLPEARAVINQLAPRQFRAKAGPDLSDRSAWTDTPKEKVSKRPIVEEDTVKSHRLDVEERNKEQDRLARKHRRKQKHRGKERSLLEMHRDGLKMKKVNAEDDGQKLRRPFNRDIDLSVHQFDDAQKRAICKKAQLLDDRFSKGESKYL